MKSNKPLWRLSVRTTLEAEEAVAELLGEIFSTAASAHFNVATQISLVCVFGPSNLVLNRTLRARVASGLAQIRGCGLDTGRGRITTARLRREDWAESWKRHFKSIEVGDALLIKPSWIKRKPRKKQAVVVLDPGLSFGTGQHATTSFCLREIARDRRAGTRRSFLDIGTGSGILAIAAAKLGYQPVDAFDFDPESIRVARANANANRVGRIISLRRDDVTKLPPRPSKQYDLVCANLISSLLIAERRRIIARVDRTGTLVLAGILNKEFRRVQVAFEALGLKLVAGRSEKEWRSGSFRFGGR